jgi:LSD1 subclass zinc finger protein
MADYETTELRCKSCGAGLHYTPGATSIICPHCGTEYVIELSSDKQPTMAYDSEILDLLRQGKQLQAIKHLRSRTGLGLKEAKAYVGELARRENITASAGASQAGCIIVIAVGVSLLIAGIAALLIYSTG